MNIVGPFIKEGKGRLSFRNFQKRDGSDFSHKKGGIGKIGRGCFKKGVVSFILILTNPFQCYLSLSVWCVCLCFFLFIYTISIGIICVSQKEPSLIASNQQMYNFYK